MVDSAPGVEVHGAVRVDPVVGGSGGRVVGGDAGWVLAEEPAGCDAGELPQAGRVGGRRDGEQGQYAGAGAVGDLRAVDRRGPPQVVRPGRGQQVRGEDGRVGHGGAQQSRLVQRGGGGGQGGGHLRGPGMPLRARCRRGQDRPVRPGARGAGTHVGDAVGQLGERAAGDGAAAGLDVGGQAEHGLRTGIGIAGDQPRRHPQAVRELVLPVAGQHLPVERRDGQIQALPEEGGEGGVGAAEVGVALAERPDGAGQPVRGARVGGIRRVGGGGRGVETAVGLHPQHDIAGVRSGRGLQVGQPAQQLVGLVAAVLIAELHPVPQVDDRGAGDVVGVVGALPVGVVRGVVGAAAGDLVAAGGQVVGVDPQHSDRGLAAEQVGGVSGLRRRGHRGGEEVQVRQVGQRRGRRRCLWQAARRRRPVRRRCSRRSAGRRRRRSVGGGHAASPLSRRATPMLESAIP